MVAALVVMVNVAATSLASTTDTALDTCAATGEMCLTDAGFSARQLRARKAQRAREHQACKMWAHFADA